MQRIIKFLIIIFISFFLTGCWDSRDIQNKNIITTIIVDYNNENYMTWGEFANIKGKKQSGEQKTTYNFSILHGKGASPIEARDDLNRSSDNPIYVANARIVIFTNNIANKGIEEYILRSRGETDFRKTMDIVTTNSSPPQILQDMPENDISIGFSIEDTLEGLTKDGTNLSVVLGDVLNMIAQKNISYAMPNIDFINNENTLTGYSIFKENKKIGSILAQERRGLIFLIGKNPKFRYIVKYKDADVGVLVELRKKSLKPIIENEKLKFDLNLEFEGEITFVDKLVGISDEDKEIINEDLKNLIQKDIQQTIDKSQKEFKCDYLYFYKYFKIYYPDEFKKINWNDRYSNAQINIDIKTNTKAAGMYEINPKSK